MWVVSLVECSVPVLILFILPFPIINCLLLILVRVGGSHCSIVLSHHSLVLLWVRQDVVTNLLEFSLVECEEIKGLLSDVVLVGNISFSKLNWSVVYLADCLCDVVEW